MRVGIYTSMRADCTTGPLPAIRLSVVPDRRGTIKATNIKQCLAAELPAFAAFYRAKVGASNEDWFELEVGFAAGRKQIQRFMSSFRTVQARDSVSRSRIRPRASECPSRRKSPQR